MMGGEVKGLEEEDKEEEKEGDKEVEKEINSYINLKNGGYYARF